MPCARIISSCTVAATPRLLMCGAAELDTFGKGLSQAVHLHNPNSEVPWYYTVGWDLDGTCSHITQRTKQVLSNACAMHRGAVYADRVQATTGTP